MYVICYRIRLRQEIANRISAIEDTRNKSDHEVLQFRHQISSLKQTVQEKENKLLSYQMDLDWARDRIEKLESALTTVSTELNLRTDTSERWEFKAGEQQQQIAELERYVSLHIIC